MKRNELKPFYVFLLGWFGISGSLSCAQKETTKEIAPSPVRSVVQDCKKTPLTQSAMKREGIVKRVVDGDTLVLADGTKVRLVGVDTPESVHPRKAVERFAREASQFTREHLTGKAVELIVDQNGGATQHRDKYRRLLAYVLRKDDGFDVNAELIKQGLALVYTKFSFERREEFRCLQAMARETKQGLWLDEPSPK